MTRRDESGVFTHAAEALELRAVLGYVASKCKNEHSRRTIERLRPTSDRGWIEDRLAEIAELRELHTVHGRLPIADTSAKVWIDRAVESRDVIPAEGLLDVMSVERAVTEVHRRFERLDEGYARLRAIVGDMIRHDELVESVDRAIDRDGAIKDGASAKLKALRRGTRKAKEELRRYTDQLAKGLGAVDYATFTGNRYMLLVPREKCRKKEGLVHSASHSGGSLYFEPFGLLEKNNALETLLLDERAEEARILSELTARIVGLADELRSNVDVWERLDALTAMALFSEEFDCIVPDISADGSIRLIEAKHPLLALSLRESGDADGLVPLDLRLDPGSRVLVITGPNAGGKTVTLKTVGLIALMFQCGLPVPCAEGSQVSLFKNAYADIGDEQSIASSLSTFTSHLRYLDEMCTHAGPDTLCLIDEIGDGTDPDEGAALAVAALERLVERGAAVVATTHYGKVKSFALQAKGVGNASMVFDDENDRPLYRLLQGTAGRSRGIDTAKRLGFCPPVVERAESMIGEDTFRLERILSELEADKLAVEEERRTLAGHSEALERLVASYEAKDRDLSEFKAAHRERAAREAEEILLRARKEIETIVKEIRESRADKNAVREGHARLKKMLDGVRPKPKVEKVERPRPGDIVSLSPSGKPSGPVTEVDGDNVAVDINGKKFNAKAWQLYRVSDAEQPEPVRDVEVDVDVAPLESTSIDVRGCDREEALLRVDQFLDRAVLNGVSEIKIIHGFGEGVLLDAVKSQLRGDARVRSLRAGSHFEGGAGVTFVTLK